MKKLSLITLSCVLGTLVFCELTAASESQRKPVPPLVSQAVRAVQTVLDVAEEELRCLQLVNEERIRRKLPVLEYDATLATASRNWSATMTRAGFKHGSGREIIARGGHSAIFAYRIWMNSPPHRAQLLNPNYTATGFGMVNGFWTGRFR